ncbi:MAG: ion channel, partial [Panacagrimonas sp.]
GLVAACIFVHFEALDRLNAAIPRLPLLPRFRILFVIVALLLVHSAEIGIFALGLLVAVSRGGFGHVAGAQDLDLAEALYVSATTYTTVGYGDLAPVGAIRLVMGLEALTGFLLLTWSASFTFLEMQRYWRPR